MQYLTAFCRRPVTASYVISGRFMRPIIVLDKCVIFRDASLNHSREIPPEAVGGGIFYYWFRYNFRSEVDNDVTSGVAGV